MSSMMAGLGGSRGKQEHCGSDPVAKDQALSIGSEATLGNDGARRVGGLETPSV